MIGLSESLEKQMRWTFSSDSDRSRNSFANAKSRTATNRRIVDVSSFEDSNDIGLCSTTRGSLGKTEKEVDSVPIAQWLTTEGEEVVLEGQLVVEVCSDNRNTGSRC